MKIERLSTYIKADPKRVILRERGVKIPQDELREFVLSMDNEQVLREWNEVDELFDSRHRALASRLEAMGGELISASSDTSSIRKRLAGAYLSMEYSNEAAALFNPSIVPHPSQRDDGSTRFVMSLRAVGEGHISSIAFMEGSIKQGQ